MLKRYWVHWVVLGLLVALVAEVGLSTQYQSPSWDEGDHIYSGYMNWKHGEYSLNPEHPPLVKLVATIPLLGLDLKVAPRQGRFFKDEAYFGGRELLFRNAPQYGGKYGPDELLLRVHMAAMVFAVVLALLLFLAGQEMFGTAAGLIAMALFVLDPTVIANAPFVTTDMGGTCGYFAALYTFYRFVMRRTWLRGAVSGVALGLALTTKHSALALVPMLGVLALGELGAAWWQARKWPSGLAWRLAAGLGVIYGVALVVLWGVYGFRYAMHPVGEVMPSLAVKMHSLPALSKAVLGFCAVHHLVPESYLYGLADVQEVGIFMPTYFFGKVYEHGLWYYFPVLLSLKWSVGTLGLLAVSAWAILTRRVGRWREVLFLAVPAGLFLVAAMGSPLNIGVRHVLPLFGFAFALAGAGTGWLVSQAGTAGRKWALAVGVLLVAHGAESVRMYPNYLPFANVFWGGPTKTHLYFSDSATDWAQQLKATKVWVDGHGVKDCWFAYFAGPFLQPADYGIPCKPLPTLDTMGEEATPVPAVVHGPILVSYGDLNGFEFGTKVRNPYQTLFERQPDSVIANGVAVFQGDFALPDASAMDGVVASGDKLEKDPVGALAAARAAVAASPRGFDANRALGAALKANGDQAGSLAAYGVALDRVKEMEPEAQEMWGKIVQKAMK
jgi:hypothetical protein